MRKPLIGLLGLYLELYDSAVPGARPRIDGFRATIAGELRKRGLDVVDAPVCRLQSEFENAIKGFEEAAADAIVTLHLAYSPSLESAGALAETALPIIVLDTTPDIAYNPSSNPDELMYNHGIHGVQDMCNLLIRNGKYFCIEAGHWESSDVLDRVAKDARAAMAAALMRSARVGRIGDAFVGMGDFAVEDSALAKMGIDVVQCAPSALAALVPGPDEPEVASEVAADLARFETAGITTDSHIRSTRAGLAARKWIEKEKLTAFSMNFLAFTKAGGVPVVPFLEASKAMSRGIGYAGEGDVLTAAMVGALASAYPETTFTEMFCPDWEGNLVYLSHMGEMNLNLAVGKPTLKELPFPYTDAEDPIVAVARFRGGEAVFVDLAPGPDEQFSLIVAPVRMTDVTGEDTMKGSIHGWFEPRTPIADFLADYSRAGGTHHAALVYGDVLADMTRFGEMMGWNVVVLA